jgi:hypothetical protein
MQFIASLVLTQMSAYRAFSGSKEQQNISAVALFIAQWPDINLIRHATPAASYQSFGTLSMKAQAVGYLVRFVLPIEFAAAIWAIGRLRLLCHCCEPHGLRTREPEFTGRQFREGRRDVCGFRFLFALLILTRQFKAMGTGRFSMSRIKVMELLAGTAS